MYKYLVAEEAARDIDLLAAHDHNLLSTQGLLGNDGGQATEEVAFAINDNWGRGESGHDGSNEAVMISRALQKSQLGKDEHT